MRSSTLLRKISLLSGLAVLLTIPTGCMIETTGMREVREQREREVQDLQNRLDEKTRAMMQLEEKYAKENRTLKKQTEVVQENVRKVQDERSTVEQQLTAKNTELAAKNAELAAALQATATEKTNLDANTAKLTAAIQTLTAERDKLAEEIKVRDQSTAAQQAALAKKGDESKGLEAQLQKAKADAADLQTKLAAAEKGKQDAEKGKLDAEKSAKKSAPAVDDDVRSAFTLIKAALKPLAEQKYASVALDESRGLVVRISADYLFEKDSVVLDKAASPTLDMLAGVFNRYPQKFVEVQGHTDATPVANLPFEDNWGVAGERANKVVRYLTQEKSVADTRIKSVSCAQFRPQPKSSGLPAARRVEFVFSNQP